MQIQPLNARGQCLYTVHDITRPKLPVTVAAKADVHTSHTAKIRAGLFVAAKRVDCFVLGFFLVFSYFHSTTEVPKTREGRG